MRMTRTVGLAAATLASMAVLAWPAHAGTDGPGGAVSEGGSVKITWTWAGRGVINDIDMEVRDSRCDAQATYAQMMFVRVNDTVPGEVRWNKDGCLGSEPHRDLEYRSNFDITGFYVRHCTDSNGDGKANAGDNCGQSGVVDNPRV